MRGQLCCVAAVLVCVAFASVFGADCSTKQCGDGRVCKMAGWIRPYCALDRSVCTLPVIGVQCYSPAPRYYYNTNSRRCTRYKGECGGTRNKFKNIRDCIRACRVFPGFFRRGRFG